MKIKVRPAFVWLMFFLPIAVLLAFIATKQKRPQESPRVSLNVAMVHQHPGKEKAQAVLAREDLTKSVAEVTGDEAQYLTPGYWPVDRTASIDLEMMLSNRRVIKLMQDIKNLPDDLREVECRRLFAVSFQKHTNACRTVVLHVLNPTSPKNEQSMLSTKMGLSAALFITAEIGRLDILGEQFKTLDQWCNEIEPLAYVPHPRAGQTLENAWIAPDFRLQVNVLRLGVLRAGKEDTLSKVDLELVSIGMKTNYLSIVPWNAKTTEFEILPDSPLDTSKGLVKYQLYDWDRAYRRPLYPRSEWELQKPFVRKLQAIIFGVD